MSPRHFTHPSPMTLRPSRVLTSLNERLWRAFSTAAPSPAPRFQVMRSPKIDPDRGSQAGVPSRRPADPVEPTADPATPPLLSLTELHALQQRQRTHTLNTLPTGSRASLPYRDNMGEREAQAPFSRLIYVGSVIVCTAILVGAVVVSPSFQRPVDSEQQVGFCYFNFAY